MPLQEHWAMPLIPLGAAATPTLAAAASVRSLVSHPDTHGQDEVLLWVTGSPSCR